MPPNLERKERRKKQTRLMFDPIDLEGTSPAGAKMTPAKIRYGLEGHTPSLNRNTYGTKEGSDGILSSAKKDDVEAPVDGKVNRKLPAEALPTPMKSSQTLETGLSIYTHEDSNEEGEATTYHSISKPRRPTTTMVGSLTRRQNKAILVDIDESDGSPPEDEATTPSKSKKGNKKVFQLTPGNDNDTNEVDHDAIVVPQRSTMTTRNSSAAISSQSAKNRKPKFISLSSDGEDEYVLPALTSKQKNKGLSDDDDDDDVRPLASSQRRHRKSIVLSDDESGDGLPLQKTLSKSSKSLGNKKKIIHKNETEDNSDDSDDIVTTSPATRRPRITLPDDEESDQEPVTSPLKRRRQPAAETDESESEVSPSKRRRQARGGSDKEDSDFPSVEKLRKGKGRARPSPSRTTPMRATRQSYPKKHRTAKEKQMELLRRKRAGENIDSLTSSDSEEEPKAALYDTDSDHEMLSDFEDESDVEEVASRKEKPRKPRRGSNAAQDAYDSDFVVEDDDEPLGVPHLGLLDIPLEFRHAAHKPMKDHFKDAIEWMVHRKINPAFPREDEVYVQAFKKLDAEYHGYAKSKFVSSQWTAPFTKAVWARPIYKERRTALGEGYTADGVAKCDACNHRKHVPSYAIQLSGKAYDRNTLEEIDQESEYSNGSEDSDGEHGSVDINGAILPPEDKEWFSGNVCRSNAQTAHTLIHWKYALNEWVIDELENEGFLTPEKLAEREKMKAKQRREYANSLVDSWAANGTVKNLYRDFKRQLETAREVKTGGRWA